MPERAKRGGLLEKLYWVEITESCEYARIEPMHHQLAAQLRKRKFYGKGKEIEVDNQVSTYRSVLEF